VDEASITLIQAGQPKTVGFAGKLAVVLDERQYKDGFGPCTDAAVTGQTILIEDTARSDLYPSFCCAAHRAGIHRSPSVGITTVQDTAGGLNLYGAGPAGPFDQDARGIATAFAGYAGVAFLNAAHPRHGTAAGRADETGHGLTLRDRAGQKHPDGPTPLHRR
jgi:hypothetical protein